MTNVPLPLTHVTPWEKFIKILGCGELIPQRCRFFKKDILYLNYGRLAHKPSEKEYNWTENEPVIFFFKNDIIKKGSRFYPFDTGAILAGRFRYTMLNVKNLESNFAFLIDEKENPARWIQSIYASAGEYVNLKTPKFLTEETRVKYLLKEAYRQIGTNDNIDYRLTSLECHFKNALNIKDAFAIGVPYHKKEELSKISKYSGLNFFYYMDESLNGELPFDLSQRANSIFSSFI